MYMGVLQTLITAVHGRFMAMENCLSEMLHRFQEFLTKTPEQAIVAIAVGIAIAELHCRMSRKKLRHTR